jgi:hypothetical protein
MDLLSLLVLPLRSPTGKDVPVSPWPLTSGKTLSQGFLMRIGKGPRLQLDSFKVGSDSTVQVASQCTSSKIGGISQKSASSKTTSKVSLLRVNSAISGLTLEVTVVFSNGDSGSTWYKSDSP